MALFDDLLKGSAGKGLAIGLGVAVLAPVILPVLATVARPVARAAIKTGIIMFEKGRESVAEFGEVMEDLVAEARADIEESHAAHTSGDTQTVQETVEEAEQTSAKE